MKKSLVTKMLAFVMALFTGCCKFDREVMSDNQEAKKVLDEVIGYLENGDAEGIKGMMTESTLINCKDDIDSQIENMMSMFSEKKLNLI